MQAQDERAEYLGGVPLSWHEERGAAFRSFFLSAVTLVLFFAVGILTDSQVQA